jgi:hypothetical protein
MLLRRVAALMIWAYHGPGKPAPFGVSGKPGSAIFGGKIA